MPDGSPNKSPTPPQMNRMNILLTFLIEAVKKHGIAFLAMLFLVLYFHSQNEKLERKFDRCNTNIIDMYQSHNTQLIEALNRNSTALEKITENK